MTKYERVFREGQKSMAPDWKDINKAYPEKDGNYFIIVEVLNEKYAKTGTGDRVTTIANLSWGQFDLDRIDLEYYNYRILFWARIKNLAFPIPMDDKPANLYLVY